MATVANYLNITLLATSPRFIDVTIPGNINIDFDSVTGTTKPDDNATYSRVFYQDEPPTSGVDGMQEGDLWVDTNDGNKTYIYDTATWIDIQDADIATAQSTADGKIITFSSGTVPATGSYGDLWVHTGQSNKMYRCYHATLCNSINAGEWQEVQDGDILDAQTDATQGINDAASAQSTANTAITNASAAQTSANDAQATADGKIVTFYQTSPPTTGTLGDLWIDTDDGNKIYRCNGATCNAIGVGKWFDTQDTAIVDAQATADGKIVTFYQSSIPSTGTLGDLWIDSDDGNKLYRCNGVTCNSVNAGEWVETQDDDIAAAQADADASTSWLANIKHASDTTVIDGGKIYTGSVTATQINTTSINISTITNDSNFDSTQPTIQTGISITGGGMILSSTADIHTLNKDSYNDTTPGFYIGANTFGIGNASNYLQWTGTALNISGSITFTSGSTGYTNITDAPGDLSELDSTASTKLGTIAENADVTSANTAADISGQGDYATLSTLNLTSPGTYVSGSLPVANTDATTNTGIFATLSGKLGSGNITTYMDSDSISTTQISASYVYAGNISANNITAGTITGDYISGGTIDAVDISASFWKGNFIGDTGAYLSFINSSASLSAIIGTNLSTSSGSVGVVGNADWRGLRGISTDSGAGWGGNFQHTLGSITTEIAGYFGATKYGLYTSTDCVIGGTVYTFTGSHDSLIKKNEANAITTGDIAVDILVTSRNGVSCTITEVALSSTINQKNVVGVFNSSALDIPTRLFAYQTGTETVQHSSEDDQGENEDGKTTSEIVPIHSVEFDNLGASYRYAGINSLGEGQVNVCEEGGDFDVGDFITTSSIEGKGMLQADDILHNYTVAKTRESLIWANETVGVDGCFDIGGVKCKMIACTYHCG